MAKLSNAGMTLIRKTGEAEWWGNGHWQHPWLVRNALCPDGRRRTAYLGPDADTFFSWPARVKIGGVWVKGFFGGDDTDAVFTAYDYQGK